MILAAGLFLAACQGKKKAAAVPAAVHADTLYTCSMHPQVMQDRPGKCPICGMELVPVKMSVDESEGSVQLSDQQMQLGGSGWIPWAPRPSATERC